MSGASIEHVLTDKRVCVCAGSGGVGKTTASAAIALGMARRGLTVAVVTIDPARRLATALGLEDLGNEPRRVEVIEDLEGELWAMMLDSKRTFDGLIERLAPDAESAREVLENRIYQQLSSAVAGSQEFTAVAKLFELDREGRFDLIVLDTPPSRNALDFLDAPDRLTGFFQGRAVRMFLRPAGFGGKLFGAGTGMVFSLLKRVTGVDLLNDLSVFFRALGGLIDGFTERARGVKALLSDPATTFVIITSPEHEPAQEAVFFHSKLAEARMPFGGLVVNRVHASPESGLPDELADELGESLAERVREAADAAADLAARDRASMERLDSELDSPPTYRVPLLPGDVHDVEGLEAISAHLFGEHVAQRAAA